MSGEHEEAKSDLSISGQPEKRVGRREFLKMAGIAGAGITAAGGLGALVSGCGGADETTTTAAAETTTTTAATTQTSVVKGQTKTMTIGCTMPFSGNYGFYGIAMKPGVQAMVDILNEAGGVQIGDDLYQINMLFPDDGADPKRGPICAQQLIDAGAVANVGSYTQFGPFVDLLNAAGVMAVGIMWNDIDVNKNKYFMANEGYTGPFAGYLAAKMFDTKSFCRMVYDWQESDLGAQVKIMQSGHDGKYPTDFSNGKIKSQVAMQVSGNQDFSGLLAKLHDDGVDTICSDFGPGDYALAIKQAADQGYKFNWVTTGTMTDLAEFIKIGGRDNVQNAMANCPVPWLYKDIVVDPELVDLGKKITDRVESQNGLPWNQQYLGIFEWGCGHLQLLLDFMKQAGSIDPDAIMEKAVGGTAKTFGGNRTMGGQARGLDRLVIMPSNIMYIKIAGDVYDYAGEIEMPPEFA